MKAFVFLLGHAIEAGWFALDYLIRADIQEHTSTLDTVLTKFIKNPVLYGWDHEYGGLYYFLDARG